METWEAWKGAPLKRTATIRDGSGAAIVFTGSEPLSCKIWSGEDQTAALTLTPTWATAGSGTVTVTMTGTNTSSLDAGEWQGMIYVTTADGVLPAFAFQLVVYETAGAAAAPVADITYDELKLYAPFIDQLHAQNAGMAGFLDARARARTWLFEMIRDRYRPQPGRARRYVSADGTTSGTFLRFSDGPNGAQAPSVTALYGYLTAGGLQMTDRIRETEAHYAAAVILQSMPGRNNDYQQQGQQHLGRANALFPDLVIDVDPNGGSSPTMRVHRDVDWLT